MPRKAVVKRGLLGVFHIRLRRFSISDRSLEILGFLVSAHLNICGFPTVGRVDITRTRGADAHQIGQGAQQHKIPRPRPGIVHADCIGVIQHRVEKEVDRWPAATGSNVEPRKISVHIVGTVDVSGISQIFIVPRGTGQTKCVMPPARVLHDLDQRFLVDRPVLAENARCRI